MTPGGLKSLDVRGKCALFILFMIWTVLFNDPAVHAAMALMILGTGLLSGLPVRPMLSRLVPLAPLFLMILVFTGFTRPGGLVHPENGMSLIEFGEGVCLTRGGLLTGLTFLLRLVNMVVFTGVLLAATPLEDLITLFTRLRLSRTLSFVVTLAIRFVPELDKRRERIVTAQRARGIDFSNGSLFRRFRARIAVMVPLIINALLISDQLTMALMNRGFGFRNQWTILSEPVFSKKDYLVLALCMAGLAAGILIRIRTGWGRI